MVRANTTRIHASTIRIHVGTTRIRADTARASASAGSARARKADVAKSRKTDMKALIAGFMPERRMTIY